MSRSIRPASTRIEVVRGPATLLYGVERHRRSRQRDLGRDSDRSASNGAHGGATFDFGTAASGRRCGAADVLVGNGRWALHVVGQRPPIGRRRHAGRRRSRTPSRAAASATSASRWTGEHGYFGGSYGYDDTKYGIPVRRGRAGRADAPPPHVRPAGGADSLGGPFEAFRVLLRRRGGTSTTSSKARRSARSSRTTPTDINLLRPGTAPRAG